MSWDVGGLAYYSLIGKIDITQAARLRTSRRTLCRGGQLHGHPSARSPAPTYQSSCSDRTHRGLSNRWHLRSISRLGQKTLKRRGPAREVDRVRERLKSQTAWGSCRKGGPTFLTPLPASERNNICQSDAGKPLVGGTLLLECVGPAALSCLLSQHSLHG